MNAPLSSETKCLGPMYQLPVPLTSDVLWGSVRNFVEEVHPGLPQAKFDKACVGVYEAMRFLIGKVPKR